jgi:3-deoxy-D-manno-octulosonate 8-phosphate phosphatase KdsC-like HAD superfamily phosphatase
MNPQQRSYENLKSHQIVDTLALLFVAVYTYRCALISTDSASAVHCGLKKLKIKEMVHKFGHVRQTRTGCNMVKSSSPNAPSA